MNAHIVVINAYMGIYYIGISFMPIGIWPIYIGINVYIGMNAHI